MPSGLAHRRHVADGEDACVAGDQPAEVDTAGDLVPRESDPAQLSMRDVAVLRRRELGDATSVVSIRHMRVEVTFVGFSPPYARVKRRPAVGESDSSSGWSAASMESASARWRSASSL